jgi:hypothetical protein
MNNKLDAFNNDKIKCKKCKKYYPSYQSVLCKGCNKKWRFFSIDIPQDHRYDLDRLVRTTFEDWCNNEQ